MAQTKLSAERIDLSGGAIRNESNKLPGHKQRMLAHFQRNHKAIGPLRDHTRSNKKICNCGIYKPNNEFDWDRLAESLIT